jgi:hypothetical protein
MNAPPSPTADQIILYAYGRDEASTTIECYTGEALVGDTSGDTIYSIFYKQFGSPTFTQIYSYQGGPASLLDDPPFIVNKYWIYTHNHGSNESGQYYVTVNLTLDATVLISNTISVLKFRGFGSRPTRLSGNGPLKSSRKTRNETPKF